MIKCFFYSILLTAFLSACDSKLSNRGGGPQQSFHLIDKIVLEKDMSFDSTLLGGLSSIDFIGANRFVLISDDRSEYSPARIYELVIEYDLSGIQRYEFENTIYLKNKAKELFHFNELDPESIRYRKSSDSYFYTSEGGRSEGRLGPFIWEIDKGGNFISEVDVPEMFNYYAEKGLRDNGAFESLTFENDTIIWYANELPLKEDGDMPSLESGKYPIRVVRHDIKNDVVLSQFVYNINSIQELPKSNDGFYINSVPEILYIDTNRLWVLERSYVEGVGNYVVLYEMDTENATDVKDLEALEGTDYSFASKKLLFDFSDLNQNIDNIEGMTFGPDFSDGERSLFFISDDNFNEEQETQLWLFKVSN